MTQDSENSGGIAPADARTHAPWSRAGKIAAYVILAAAAIAAIWLVDRRVGILTRQVESGQLDSGAPR